MGSIAFADVLKAWTSTYDGLSQGEIDRRILGFSTIVQGIAEHGSVSPEAFGASADLSPQQVSELFRGLAASGLELGADGNLVGAALSVRRTPHRFRVADKQLYAWCALDALFLPGLLDETAEVRSRCPTTDASIRLVVSPSGIEERTPVSAVLSVVIPGSSGLEQTGPESPT